MNPVTTLLSGVVLALALFGGGYWLGTSNGANKCVASEAKGTQAAQTVADKESTRKEAVGAAREVSRDKIRVVYRTIKEKVDENVKNVPGYNGCALDSDGLRIWNSANAGGYTPVSGEPDYRLLDAAIGAVGQVGRLVAEPRRVDGVVRAVPGPAEKAGGM